jgi:RecJ-like exonuclease
MPKSTERDQVLDRPAPGDEAPPETSGTGEDICPVCHGKGKVQDKPCENCEGTGKVIRGIGGA